MAVAQFVGGAAAGRKDGGADAHPDAMLARSGQQLGFEGGTDPFGKPADAFADIRQCDRDREFIAAQSRNSAGGRGFRGQSLRDGTKHQIAAGMSQHVVDLLKAVEADHQQGDLAAVFRPGNHRGQLSVKRVAVGEPGQRIMPAR